MKSLLKTLLGDRVLGQIDYIFDRPGRDPWNGAFNGQTVRQQIFLDLVKRFQFQAIAETGTFLGVTTLFLARTKLPVYTVEANPRFHAFAQMRFRAYRNQIHLYGGDSRAFLNRLHTLDEFPRSKIFFYLDAHWEADLPLCEELDIIFQHWADAVVLVDDFQVPSTTYGYDDYGPGKALTLEYLKPIEHLSLQPYFPTVGPDQESGQKRGWVVLGKSQAVKTVLASMDSLRVWHPVS